MASSTWLSAAVRVAESSTLVLRPSGELPEAAPDVVLPDRGARADGAGIRRLLRKAKHDRRVARLLIKPGDSGRRSGASASCASHPRLQTSGKPVYAFLEMAGAQEYLLASAADRIVMLPSATLDLTGWPATRCSCGDIRLDQHLPGLSPHRRLQDRRQHLHGADVHAGASRMSESLNRDQFEQIVRMISDGRRQPEDELRALIDRGPFRRTRRCGWAWWTSWRTRTSSTISRASRSARWSRSPTTRARHGPRRAATGEAGRHQRRRHHRQRPQRPRSGERSAGRVETLVSAIRAAQTAAPEPHPARRQPRRVVDCLGRDLARADDRSRTGCRWWSRCRTSRRPAATTWPWPATSSSRTRGRSPGRSVYTGKFVTGGRSRSWGRTSRA